MFGRLSPLFPPLNYPRDSYISQKFLQHSYRSMGSKALKNVIYYGVELLLNYVAGGFS